MREEVNYGWTYCGRKYHRATWQTEQRGYMSSWRSAGCGQLWLDQTTLKTNGEGTGALVPLDLKPCKRCFPAQKAQEEG